MKENEWPRPPWSLRLLIDSYYITCYLVHNYPISRAQQRLQQYIRHAWASLRVRRSLIELFIISMQGNAKVMGSRLLEDRESIKAHVSGNNAAFNQKIAAALGKDYSRIEQLGVFEHRNQPGPHIFFYHAAKYRNEDREDLDEYMVREIHRFYSNHTCSYALAYVHDSFVDFIYFRRFLERWPEHFFQRLRRVYIVGASLMVRFIETCSFGTFYRLCDELFLNLPDEEALREADQAVLKAIGETATSAPTFKDSLKIIESALYGKVLTDYELYTGKYPVLILRLLGRLVRRPQDLQIEGIFRKSCDSEELEKMERRLQRGEWEAIDEERDILVVCGCLKKVMNNLRLPLFNYAIYDRVLNFPGGDERAFVRGLLKEMEYVNQKLFVLLTVFLCDFIIRQKDATKMNAYNLSVVFGPCFFRPKEYDLKDLINSGRYAKVLVTCFDEHEEIFETAECRLAEDILKGLQRGELRLE